MESNGLIAVFNATRNEMHEFESTMQVQNYLRDVSKEDSVYVLQNYAFVDTAEELVGWAHDDFIADGWEVLQ